MYRLKRRTPGWLLLSAFAVVAAASLAGPAAAQQSAATGRSISRAPDQPLMAVVSLNQQRITVYGLRGKMMEAPVSTGQRGYETPAGIFSILQKRRHHYSNLYNDASMPFMQRLTWSGIALHAGDLPGYPASHGCVRMPYDFARQMFALSRKGMRVMVVREDVSPVEFAHPALFRPAPLEPPGQEAASDNVHLSSAQRDAKIENAALTPRPTRRSMIAARQAAAEAAARKAEELRLSASRIVREAEALEEALYVANHTKREAAAEIQEANVALADPEYAKEVKGIKAKAEARLAAAQAEIDAIYARGRDKIEAARAAREQIRAAEAARVAALGEVQLAMGQPVSVFISRKTQRLYVRQALQSLFESDVTIHAPDTPIGTTVFTATDWIDDVAELGWTAVSMYPHRASGASRQRGEPAQTSPEAAKAALERISIPQDAIDRISKLVTPGSSLIISDEGLSKETGEATEFIVVMGGEPQGGIRRRTRMPPAIARGYDSNPSGGSGLFSWW